MSDGVASPLYAVHTKIIAMKRQKYKLAKIKCTLGSVTDM